MRPIADADANVTSPAFGGYVHAHVFHAFKGIARPQREAYLNST
jgi:hypothetical protein